VLKDSREEITLVYNTAQVITAAKMYFTGCTSQEFK
jgi:hypothetical protein